jgi:hypothetical protein
MTAVIVIYYGLLFLGALFFAIYKELRNEKNDKY